VDSVDELGPHEALVGLLSRGAYAVARGWALQPNRSEPVDTLRVSLGGDVWVDALTGLPRPDVAKQFGPGALNSGFVAAFPVMPSPGRHEVLFEAGAGSQAVALDVNCFVTVRIPEDPLAGRRERRDGWAFAIDGVHRDVVDGTNVSGVTLTPASRPYIKLWALDVAERCAAARIVARSGGVYLRVLDGYVRRDAALALGLPDAERCGFAIPVSAAVGGAELVELFALGSDNTYVRLGALRVTEQSLSPFTALPRSAHLIGHLEEVVVDGTPLPLSPSISVRTQAVLTLRGWVADGIGPRRAGGVFAEVDGSTLHEGSYGGSRPDVAAANDAPWITECQFEVEIAAASLSPGSHRIAVGAFDARRNAVGQIDRSIVVDVLSGSPI
jgi:hypothetical protein